MFLHKRVLGRMSQVERREVGLNMTTRRVWSGHPAVDAVCKAIETDRDWDTAENNEKLHFYILRAAQNVGRFEPFSDVETTLNDYLVHRMAGKRLCDYAWRMFAHPRND